MSIAETYGHVVQEKRRERYGFSAPCRYFAARPLLLLGLFSHSRGIHRLLPGPLFVTTRLSLSLCAGRVRGAHLPLPSAPWPPFALPR